MPLTTTHPAICRICSAYCGVLTNGTYATIEEHGMPRQANIPVRIVAGS